MKGPLFKWFGSKWLSAKQLPAPRHSHIIEPFAGGAGYACRWASHDVTLWEANEQLLMLWRWLTTEASEADIRAIPLKTPEGTDIRLLGMNVGQTLLLKHWQRTNNVGNCWTISPWGNKPGQWTANTRARVSEEVYEVKHWRVAEPRWDETATWFIDPMYQLNYQYRMPAHDYTDLARKIHALPEQAQVIVCEARCQKTGEVPTWLPFADWQSRITSRRKAENNHHSKEMIWCRP